MRISASAAIGDQASRQEELAVDVRRNRDRLGLFQQSFGQGHRDGAGNLGLRRENVAEIAIVGLGQDVIAARGIDELCRDADLVAGCSRTLPSRTVRTRRTRAISRMSSFLSRKAKEEVRAATTRSGTLARSLSNSSDMPSLKYALSGSPLRLVKGSTAIEAGGTDATGSDSGCGVGADFEEEHGQRRNRGDRREASRQNPTGPGTERRVACRVRLQVEPAGGAYRHAKERLKLGKRAIPQGHVEAGLCLRERLADARSGCRPSG